MPHAALWVVQHHGHSLHALRPVVSMPHAALWVVQLRKHWRMKFKPSCFNATRGFVGGATAWNMIHTLGGAVSMPHAALWVVQQRFANLQSRSE